MRPIDLDEHYIQNAEQNLAEARLRCPVQAVTGPDGDGWLVSRYPDVVMLLSDPSLINDPDTGGRIGVDDVDVPVRDPETQLVLSSMLYSDGPAHFRLRRVVSRSFTPGAIARLRPKIEAFVAQCLDDMEKAETVDLVASFCTPIPLFVITEVLGIPEEDRAQFVGWARALNDNTSTEVWRNAAAASANYLRELIAVKRADPTADIFSDLTAAADKEAALTEPELVSTGLLLAFAGIDTMVGLLAGSVIALLSAPEQMALLRAEPSLAVTALDELVRHASPVNITVERYATEAIAINQTTIAPGEKIMLSLLSANHDVEQFTDADRLDLTRSAAGHVAFGGGAHYCVGVPLARLETSIALAMLFARFPDMMLAVDPETLPKRNSRLMNSVTTLPVHPRGRSAPQMSSDMP